MRKLPRSFYLRSTLSVARDLPGKLLVRRLGGRTLTGRIVEVEAYLGLRDPASHAYRGMTPRNSVMFGAGGRLYVYFTYGMHFCCNVVTERAGPAGAVLIRAVEPLEGMGTMTRLRGGTRTLHSTDLCSGPAKLCQAFGIGRKENGADLCGTTIWIAEDETGKKMRKIGRSERIGITSGREQLWRFFLKGSPYLSRPEKKK